MKGVKMGNNGRNVRLSKQQIERRRRKRLQKRIFYLSLTVILCILLFCIWNIDVRLKEIQTTLKHFETRRYGVSDTGSYGTGEKEDKDEEIDYNLNFTFNKAQKREVRAGLSNTFGFGGHNACVVFKKYAE